jgi:hypothetical protein
LKNQNKRVLALVSACFFIYLLVSIIFKVFSLSWEPFDCINLIADVFPNKEKQKADSLASQPKINVKETTEQDFDLYKNLNSSPILIRVSIVRFLNLWKS